MSVTVSGPRGWSPGKTETRFADRKPTSFDRKARTVDCVISMGSPVQRFYGTEVLRISPAAVNLERMEGGSIIPVLDSHQSVGLDKALGRYTKTWFERKALMGTIRFNQTPKQRWPRDRSRCRASPLGRGRPDVHGHALVVA
jgi:hypothetical protein